MLRHCTFALILSTCLVPMSRAAGEPVSIEEEPRHRLQFENSHVRLFDVQMEPGYQALYHWHRNDGVFVNISAAPTVAQDWGGAPVRRGERAIGETYFIGYSARPKAHSVANSGTTAYRVTDTEILSACGPAEAAREGPNQTLLIDNERVFVTRVILHPGEATELFAPCGMLVSVSGGSVAFGGPGGEEKMALPPAGFKWRESRQTVKLTNVGETVFHGVDIRLK